ncbi:MAG: putative 4-hydroxybenzoate polyprenyltransferase [Phycisphaerae bacterium]|nr:putative 4-hydroxybenzoate polyprenyltransferase [Phycisphaerae bacterium]
MNSPDTLLARIRVLLDNIKFAHTVFALPFALMAMFLAMPPASATLAGRLPHWGIFALVLVCMVAARSAAMTANRIHDVRFDARNPRTAARPMVTGRLSGREAWAFVVAAGLLFLAGCAGFWIAFRNPWPMLLAGPALAVLCCYPFAKRFTSLSHFWLGLALGLGPIGAWLATNPATIGPEAIVLCGAVLFWTAGFDIIYACQDVAVDRREGLFAIPARLGVAAALWISRSCHVVAAALLIALGLLDPRLGWLYGIGVAIAVALLIVEQSLVKPTDLSKVNVAFFTLNGVVSITLACFAIADVLGG